MTQTKASIILKRLHLLKGDKSAYDEEYHKGINIIRSRGNSTGKTTIMDAIFFVLGGDVEEWTDEALACDCVIAEISFSGKILTFRREIGKSRYPAIYMYEGPYLEAVKSSLNWLKFSHKRSSDRESFSQAIFKLLGYPENKLSSFANITIHEILRLVYSDQLTAVNKIFRQQNFDSDEMRQTVGEFLLGVDDLDLHGLRLQLRNEEKELSNLAGRIRATQDIFTSAGLSPDGSQISIQIDQVAKNIDELRERIAYLESPAKKVKNIDESEDVTQIRKELSQTKNTLRELRDRREALAFEIEDSTLFISSLEERKKALSESEATRESLGELRFEFCPACLSKIDESIPANNSVCHLCKIEKSDENDATGFLRMQFEVNYQIRESKQLLESRQLELRELDRKIAETDTNRKLLQERYNSFVETSDPITAELKDALTRVGQNDKTLENLRDKQKLIQTIDDLSQEKSKIARNISSLSDQIERREKNREMRWQTLQKRISDLTIEILRNDIPSEETFANATDFEFDFAKNKLVVDGRTKFSASSVCYLKSAFLFSLFLVSLEDNLVLFPRFLLMDNIEDKGSTPERVQNMHKIIIRSLENVDQDHQLIFTTSVLSNDLNDSDYCVGPEYSFNLKTLDI
ncbi:MAG: AAA family ATPase [Desulfotignum sp.]|nr:AAA family ATPase [Desulfotignum sp.]